MTQSYLKNHQLATFLYNLGGGSAFPQPSPLAFWDANLPSCLLDWLALHLKFGSVHFQQFGGISRPHVDQLQI